MRSNLLAFLIIGHFVTDINTGALPAFLPFIKESLQLTYAMTASIILVFNVTSSVIQPLFGFLSDRWSLRWLLPFGCFIAPLGLGLLGLSPSYAWILLFASLSGIGQASFHPEGFKMISRLGGTKKATVISFFLLAGMSGVVSGSSLADRFGYKKTVLTSFVLASLFLILFFFTKGALSLICFTAAGLTIITSNAVTMAIGQSLMPNNLGMASGPSGGT